MLRLMLLGTRTAVLYALLGGCHHLPRESVREFPVSAALDESLRGASDISIGDLDNDGDLDLVLAKGGHRRVINQILLNDGRAQFTVRPVGMEADGSFAGLLADIDGDEDLDIIVSNNEGEAKPVYVNDGKANFTAAGEWGSASWRSRRAVVGDLNGDARPDIIVANRSLRPGQRSAFCLNDGTGRFRTCRELEAGQASNVEVADMDRDGDTDIIVPHRDGGQSLILYNDGNANFTRSQSFGPETTVASASAVGDLNGDGWPDVVIGDERISTFVYLNDGRGGLLPGLQLKFDRLPAPRVIALEDLNRDGHRDIVIGYYAYAGERGSVLFNNGTGRAYRHVRFGDAQGGQHAIALGDLDGDGYPDIAASRNRAPNIVVFFNRAGPGLDIVAASAEVRTPPAVNLAPFEPRPADPSQPLLGTWSGRATYAQDYYWDVEVDLHRLEQGQTAGTALWISHGIGFGGVLLKLKERGANGTYLLEQVGGTGPHAWGEARFELRLLDQDRLQWQWWRVGQDEEFRAIATLERKK